jgi:hypothetical protein
MKLMSGKTVWSMKATHGMPLDFVLQQMAKTGWVPRWDELYESANADGANLEKLTRELQFYVKEAYPAEVAEAINERLALMPHYIKAN